MYLPFFVTFTDAGIVSMVFDCFSVYEVEVEDEEEEYEHDEEVRG